MTVSIPLQSLPNPVRSLFGLLEGKESESTESGTAAEASEEPMEVDQESLDRAKAQRMMWKIQQDQEWASDEKRHFKDEVKIIRREIKESSQGQRVGHAAIFEFFFIIIVVL